MTRLQLLNIRISIFTLLLTVLAGVTVIWDLQRLDGDFNRLYSLLRHARLDALYKRTIIMVSFDHSNVTVTDKNDPKSITTLIPMIARVDYDTSMGNDMIVYDWHGTSEYNKRIHGGEIMLKSLLGFRRYIHVNCNGVVREGRYPKDV